LSVADTDADPVIMLPEADAEDPRNEQAAEAAV
jgi:hypothetical protein